MVTTCVFNKTAKAKHLANRSLSFNEKELQKAITYDQVKIYVSNGDIIDASCVEFRNSLYKITPTDKYFIFKY